MRQFSKVQSTITIDNAHPAPQRALDCGPGLGVLNQVYGPNLPTKGLFYLCIYSSLLAIYHCNNNNLTLKLIRLTEVSDEMGLLMTKSMKAYEI